MTPQGKPKIKIIGTIKNESPNISSQAEKRPIKIIQKNNEEPASTYQDLKIHPLRRYQSILTGRATVWKTFSSRQHNQISAQIQWNNCIYLRLLKQKSDYFRDSNFFGSIINEDWPYEDVQHREGTTTTQILTSLTSSKLDYKEHLNQLYVFYLNKDRKHNVFFYSQENMSFDEKNIQQFIKCHPLQSVLVFLWKNNQIKFHYHQIQYHNNKQIKYFFQELFKETDSKNIKKIQHKVVLIFDLILNLEQQQLKKISKENFLKKQLYDILDKKIQDIDILIDGIQRKYAECQINIDHYFGKYLKDLQKM